MRNNLRSAVTMTGRRMAGARSLWRANGMKDEQFGMPVIGIVNSFTQFVPGHTHLHEIGQYVKTLIEERGCFAAEFNTIAIDDGIAMGHDGMLYSLPSREIIADSVEYMANAHQVDALFCISNCDKITPGMLMAAMRLNIPTIFVSGGPMEAGDFDGKGIDLIDAMVMSADSRCSDADIEEIERWACPGCGSCSGMFTANSMNCLNEALGLALPGNGTIVATHTNRRRLFEKAASLIVQMAGRYYFEGDDSVLPRNIATKAAFGNAMSLDIAMGGSTNTVLHRPRSRSRLHHAGYRPPVEKSTGTMQGRSQLSLSHPGCKPGRRYPVYPRGIGGSRFDRYHGQPCRIQKSGRMPLEIQPEKPEAHSKGAKILSQCTRRQIQPGTGFSK